MSLTADASVMVGSNTSAVSVGLSDQGYETAVPADSAVFSATLDGEPITLRLSTGVELGSSASCGYTATEGFYASTPSLYFNITEADVGKTIVLTASGSPFGSELSETAEIVVVSETPAFVVVDPVSGLQTTRLGGTDTFAVSLSRAPSKNVSVGITSGTVSEITVDKATLTFTSANWETPQVVTLTGIDSEVCTNAAVTITISNSVSDDAAFNGLASGPVSATNKPDTSCYPCEFGSELPWYKILTMDATQDYTCPGFPEVSDCMTHHPGYVGGQFMDWAPLINGLQVAEAGYYGRHWRACRRNVALDTISCSTPYFYTTPVGIIDYDGKIVAAIDTSGYYGLGVEGADATNWKLEIWVGCTNCMNGSGDYGQQKCEETGGGGEPA
jgi:hypothetical protein